MKKRSQKTDDDFHGMSSKDSFDFQKTPYHNYLSKEKNFHEKNVSDFKFYKKMST